jgi:hypothetical protein
VVFSNDIKMLFARTWEYARAAKAYGDVSLTHPRHGCKGTELAADLVTTTTSAAGGFGCLECNGMSCAEHGYMGSLDSLDRLAAALLRDR